ncbi:MAG TPA: hypothetical protein VFH70_06100 [Acidimicrobiales bacterium]|nr:hypothetical protein [Acidimicrobiales bacterium]
MGYEETLAAFRRGDNAEAARLARTDLDQAAAEGDMAGQVDALCMLARVVLRQGHIAEVDSLAMQAQDVADESPDRRLQRMPIHLRAVAARMAGRHDEARRLYLRSIELNLELDEPRMVAAEHRNLAYVEIRAGDLPRARELFAQARQLLSGLDHQTLAPYLIFDEATEAYLAGDYAGASAKLGDADRAFTELALVPDPDDAVEIAELRRRLHS